MTMFIIQSALLILIAFILGCLFGALLHRWFASAPLQPVRAAPAPAPQVASKPVALKAAAPVTRKPVPRKSAVKKPVAKKPVVKKAVRKPVRKKAPVRKPVTKDNLKQIKGIGLVIEKKLNASGIITFAQIAGWTKKQQSDFSEKLSFQGRIEREEWVKQAKILAKGGATQFSKRVKKGQVDTSK